MPKLKGHPVHTYLGAEKKYCLSVYIIHNLRLRSRKKENHIMIQLKGRVCGCLAGMLRSKYLFKTVSVSLHWLIQNLLFFASGLCNQLTIISKKHATFRQIHLSILKNITRLVTQRQLHSCEERTQTFCSAHSEGSPGLSLTQIPKKRRTHRHTYSKCCSSMDCDLVYKNSRKSRETGVSKQEQMEVLCLKRVTFPLIKAWEEERTSLGGEYKRQRLGTAYSTCILSIMANRSEVWGRELTKF